MSIVRPVAAVLLAGLLIVLLDPRRVEAGMPEHLVDGVPLPADVSSLPEAASPFAGAWIGTWDGRLKTILVVESVAQDGKARVVYAVADNPGRFRRAWFRYDGQVSGNTLTVFGRNFTLRFSMSDTGRLRGVLGDGFGFAVLSRADLQTLTEADAAIPWTAGRSEFLTTELVEDGRPVRLEAVIFEPPGTGPFPLAVVNHGSTGSGTDALAAGETWVAPWFADVLNERGWIVAFPQRRGRGQSDGIYDEGFSEDRSAGYTCEPGRSLAGAQRALDDLHAAVQALRRRPGVADAPILMSGQSRGGILSVAYAGEHPGETAGAINFVGGWMGEACATAGLINRALFETGGSFAEPTLWLYGRDDPYYPLAHSRGNFEAFHDKGGEGDFVEITVPGKGNGHWVMAVPTLWSEAVAAYLDMLDSRRR